MERNGEKPDLPPTYGQATGGWHDPSQEKAGYPKQPMTQPQGNVTVVQQVQYVRPSFGMRPQNMVCPHCQVQITTKTDSEAGTTAWIACVVMCAIGLWPCCCIPFCVDSFQDVSLQNISNQHYKFWFNFTPQLQIFIVIPIHLKMQGKFFNSSF